MKRHNTSTPSVTTPQQSSTAIVLKAAKLVDEGKIDDAIKLLASFKGSNDEIRNARAVCSMRQGRMDEAVRMLREFVLQPGCTWMRPELPVIYRTNFATALLLSQHISGSCQCLSELCTVTHSSVSRIKETIKIWEKQLTFFQWLGWKLGLEPNVAVAVDYLPGEFVDLTSVTPPTPSITPGNISKVTQVA